MYILTQFILFCLLVKIHRLEGTDFSGSCKSKASCYASLRNKILARQEVIHRIPPNIEDNIRILFPVTFRLFIMAVSSLEELKQVITIDAYVEVRWTQADLAWNSSQFGGLDWVYMSTTKIWTPGIMIVMGHVPTFIVEYPPTIQVFSNGTVISNVVDSLSFYCNIDFQQFPFDIQKCSIGFYIFEETIQPQIEVVEMNYFFLDPYMNITGEWVFVNKTHEIIQSNKSGLNFPRYTFSVRRQSTYYVITVIFPMVLTSVMIPLVFLIPANTGEKMSYLTAIFTSTAVFLNYISDVMPRSTSRVPHLAVLLTEVLLEGLLATLASLVVINLFRQEEKLAAISGSPQSKSAFKDVLGTQICQKGLTEHLSSAKRCRYCTIYQPKITSRQLDFVFFSIFSISQTFILIAMFGFSGWL